MLANARWGADAVQALPDPVVLHGGAVAWPVEGVSPNPATQPYPDVRRNSFTAPARPAEKDLTYFTRNVFWRAHRFNGLHGVVRRLRPAAGQERLTTFYRSPRTLRSAPTVPWDNGAALGPSGFAVEERF